MESIDQPQTEAELEAVRRSVAHGCPSAALAWQESISRRLGLDPLHKPQSQPEASALRWWLVVSFAARLPAETPSRALNSLDGRDREASGRTRNFSGRLRAGSLQPGKQRLQPVVKLLAFGVTPETAVISSRCTKKSIRSPSCRSRPMKLLSPTERFTMSTPQARRVTRELTAEEQNRLRRYREQIASELPELAERNQLRKEAREETTLSGELRRAVTVVPIPSAHLPNAPVCRHSPWMSSSRVSGRCAPMCWIACRQRPRLCPSAEEMISPVQNGVKGDADLFISVEHSGRKMK